MIKTDTSTPFDGVAGGYTGHTDAEAHQSTARYEFPEMKPCPFCGGTPKSTQMRSGHVRIECPDCRATSHVFRSASFALQAWNHRISD